MDAERRALLERELAANRCYLQALLINTTLDRLLAIDRTEQRISFLQYSLGQYSLINVE